MSSGVQTNSLLFSRDIVVGIPHALGLSGLYRGLGEIPPAIKCRNKGLLGQLKLAKRRLKTCKHKVAPERLVGFAVMGSLP